MCMPGTLASPQSQQSLCLGSISNDTSVPAGVVTRMVFAFLFFSVNAFINVWSVGMLTLPTVRISRFVSKSTRHMYLSLGFFSMAISKGVEYSSH